MTRHTTRHTTRHATRDVGDALFALLVALFPPPFRERFGGEMRALFADQRRAARARGGSLGTARLWLRTVPRVAGAALAERAEAIRSRPRTRRHEMLATLAADLRFAGRMLRKSPTFAAVAALVIALGSGAVATIFSAMNALLLRPLPGAAAPDRLVRIERVKRDGTDGRFGASYPYYAHLRDHTRSLDGVIAWSKVALTLSAGGAEGGAAVFGTLVSGNYFSALRVRPALGRLIAPEEGALGTAAPVIVVSHAFWRTRLGGDSAVVGRPIGVNGGVYTLVGVTPPEFAGLDAPIRTDAWVPLPMARQLRGMTALESASASWLNLGGRLAAGATRERARAELVALTGAWRASAAEPEWARTYDDVRLAALTGLPSDAAGALGGFLALLLGAATLVLLIASVNVASMLSARAIARRREMAVRAALGAGRGRLARQLLTEILVLFTAGALGGVAISAAATAALERMPMPRGIGNVSIALELSPDARVFAFALAVSLAAGLAFGLAPALRGVRGDVTTPLRGESGGASARRTVLGNGLVVGQLALSLLLLVASGLFLRALDRGARVDPGFDARDVAVAPFDPESWGYDDAKAHAFLAQLHERARALPGVTAVSAAEYLPLVMHRSGDEIRLDGATPVPVDVANVGADYFTAIRLPIVAGRAIGARDDERSARVAVVNETFARRHWPDGSAVGRAFRFHDHSVTIVGVARDAKYGSLAEDTPPMVYFPLAQEWRARQFLLVRGGGGAAAVGAAVRAIVRDLDPALPHPAVTALREENAIVLLPQRVAATVTASLGVVGLLLASVGLYGVVSYSVGRRTREIGIRVAIGARRGDVLGMVLRDGLRLAGAGVAIGVALAAGASRLLASLLFDVSPLDLPTFAATSALLVAIAVVATLVPARRAAAADPKSALRVD